MSRPKIIKISKIYNKIFNKIIIRTILKIISNSNKDNPKICLL